MTDKIDDGGPAFPHSIAISPNGDMYGSDYFGGGMSLRDWFAGQALPAIIAVTSAEQHTPQMRDGETSVRFAIARDAYDVADAMLAVCKGGAS